VRKRLLRGALALGLLALGAVGTGSLLKKLAFFSVRRVELVGARYLTADEVTRALRLRPHASIFDDTEPLARRAALLPGVIEVRVSRRLPGVLRVVVREAEPVALTERAGRLVLLDPAGRALPFDPTSPAADLPLAESDSVVAGLLARLRESDPELFALVQRGSRFHQDIVLELGAGRILFRAGASDAAIRDLSLVAGVLTRQGRAWRELDARFLPRVIVRGSGA
jgi:cell division septal protein FtsQ